MGRGTHGPVRHAQLDRAGLVPARRDEGAGTHAMKVIIVGCGRVGARVAAELDSRGERHRHRSQRPRLQPAAPDLRGPDGARQRHGRGRAPLGGTEEADLLMSLTEGDNRNALSAQVAKHTFGVPRVIAKINDPLRSEAYRALGPRDDLPHRDPRGRARHSPRSREPRRRAGSSSRPPPSRCAARRPRDRAPIARCRRRWTRRRTSPPTPRSSPAATAETEGF
jgi:hypothetical protein